jgi:DNA-binding LytR/AlgR family response regulator
MLKILIVDDDANSMRITRQALELLGNNEIVGEVGSGINAMEFIKENAVDLVLLDIEMQDMSGFDVASCLHKNYPKVQYVFLTGHTDFAVDGYTYQPLSFLVKPISISRLEQILELAEEKCNAIPETAGQHKQIGLHVDARLEIVDVADVIYLETVGRKVRVVCKNGRTLDSSETMKKLFSVFEDYGFYRCHQSFAVQLDQIESISSDMFHRSYTIKLRDLDKEIPLSRDKSAPLRTILEQRGIHMI